MPTDDAQQAVKNYFEAKMSPEIEELARLAWWDLWNGPHSAEDYEAEGAKFRWPGYSTAIDKIREWAVENVTEVWANTQFDEILESEPEEEIEDYVHYDRSDVMRVLFKDLVSHGGL